MPDRLNWGVVERAGDIRERIWGRLMRERAAIYPLPAQGHNPNFKGAGEAAGMLCEALLGTCLKPGDAVLSYPDYVLKPLRKGLLEHAISVIVPAKYGKGYRYLDSGKVNPKRGSSIAGAEREGAFIAELTGLSIKLCAVAGVAVSRTGEVLTKGYGFHLPEDVAAKPRVTIMHPLQQVEALPEWDDRVFMMATPERLERYPGGT